MFKKNKKFPFYKQYDMMDCGPTCLRMIAKYYGKVYSPEYLRKISHLTSEGVLVGNIVEGAEKIGIKALPVNVNWEVLEKQAPLPCIVHWRQRHYVIVYKIEKEKVYVADPAHGLITYTKEAFLEGWQNTRYLSDKNEGLLILLEPSARFHNHNPENKKNEGFKILLPYLRPYKKYIFQLFIGLFVGSAIQLILPFLTQSVVDKGINYRDLNFIHIILIAQLMLFASQSGVTIIRSWLLLIIGARINISLASDFLIKLMKLPISFFDAKMTGDVLQRVQDSRRIETFLTSSPNTLFSVFNMIIFLGVLFYYNVTIFIIFLVGALIYVSWVLIFMKKRALLEYRRFDQSSGNSSSLIQIVNGIQEIKINNSEKRRRWDWEEDRIKLYRISLDSLKLAQYQGVGANAINELKNIFISYVAAVAVINGEMTLGMMLAVQYIIGQLNAPLLTLVNFFREAQDAKISLERMDEVQHEKNEDDIEDFQDDFNINEDLTLKKVSFRYGGEKSSFVLKDINFTIPKNKVTAIVGESGSGKTTLLRLLLKLYKPTEGKIQLGNINLSNIDSSKWRNSCGVVMQDGYIFTDSIARNITESNSEGIIDKAKLIKSVQIANIEDVIERLPSGYNTRIGPPGSSGMSLSGGQRQRILIARAVYKSPQFIFFDEATSALDANNEKTIMTNLEHFMKNKTAVVIAHRLSTVKNADQIIVLDNGEIVERGNHEELIKKKGYYFKLVKNQLELSK
ncbi:peptidase domain-containing ABC transporter [Tenacibaculum maritimum]|uniref:peptidase domain-containing ABC transporter n=1 Tax=Tenacibaculum maritimum TaxID=107401 RepID=UPI0038901803